MSLFYPIVYPPPDNLNKLLRHASDCKIEIDAEDLWRPASTNWKGINFMIKELIDATTNTTLFFAYAYTTDGKPDIGFRLALNVDPIVDEIAWLVAADAYVNNVRIASVDDMIMHLHNKSDIKIKVKVQGIYKGKIITIELGDRKCKNLRYDEDRDRYLIDIY